MELTTQLHTVFILIGPSGAGKTYFTENYLMPSLKDACGAHKLLNIQHLSSDKIRKDILGDHTLTKYDPEMLYVSEQAFSVLFNRLKNATSFPVNAEFVVVDTTGLSKEFRDKIIDISKQNHYNVEAIIFDYKDKEEYFRHSDNVNKRVTYKHVRRLREGYREIRAKDYGKLHKVRNKDFHNISFKIDKLDLYKRCLLDDSHNYYPVIGDVHGCYTELIDLLTKMGCTFDDEMNITSTGELDQKFILAGDIVDKGPESARVVEFIYRNRDNFLLVLGNHENFVSKYIRGEISKYPGSPSTDFIQEYFDTALSFTDSTVVEKFFDLVDNSVPFAKHRDFIVTHVPCKKKYLGKLDSKSFKNQTRHRMERDDSFDNLDDYTKHMESNLEYLREEAVRNQPFHIFGHYPLSRAFRCKNKMGIDTGCVHGNKLTSVTINNHYSKPFICDVKSKETYKESMLVDLFGGKNFNVDVNLDDLEVEDRIRIRKLAENKVNFISGTMSPSDKNEVSLECLDTAFDYYRNKGINKVILQPKYMGSRSNIYLHRDELDKCFAVSRNGYKIRNFPDRDLTPEFQRLQDKHREELVDKKILMRIMDSELMPWRALGAGLIDRQFELVRQAVGSENALLKDNGFEEMLAKLEKESETVGYKQKKNEMSKKDLVKEIGHHKFSSYRALEYFNWIPLENQEKLLDVYSEQVDIYGSEGELHFKPFSILKDIYEDGTEKVYMNETDSNIELFKQVSDDTYLVVDLNNTEDIAKAHEFYRILTQDKKMEGVVVKPEFVYNQATAPYLKVRNPNYLTIVYGYNYTNPKKLERLINRKSINKKLVTSIKEFEIGRRLLEIPMDTIDKNNKEWVSLVARMITEEKRERGIDPRL